MSADIMTAKEYFGRHPDAAVQESLPYARQAIQAGDWVTFHVRVPVSDRNTVERHPTIAGTVLSLVDSVAVIKVQSLPDYVEVHGLNWDSEVQVPLDCLTAVSKPVPPTGERQ